MSAPPMLERDAVRATIELALERARTGLGGTLFIVGDAGLGKTTLLDHARTLATGFEVGAGRGHAMEASLPFGVITAALTGLGGRLSSTNPAVPVAALDARAAYFYSALQLVQSSDRPVLLALDDLHWADPDSLALISFLGRRISGNRVAIVATLRPWPDGALVIARDAVQRGEAQMETLLPLSERAAAQLLGDALSGEDARAAWEASGGNPLLLEELARGIRGGRPLSEMIAGDGLANVLLARFAGPGMNLRYAQAAAVFGSQFRPDLVAELTGLGEREADQALHALLAAGLVRAARPGWAQFAHPLFRQALYEDQPEPIREQRHAAVFRLLVAHGAEPGEAADHAVLGRLVGDAQAITILQRAGRAALAAGAVASAHDRLQAAEELAGPAAAPGLLMSLAETLLSTGEPARAVDVYGRVIDAAEASPATQVDAIRMRGRALFVTGQAEEAESQFALAVQRALPDDPAAATEALLDHCTACWITGGPTRALAYANRARQLAKDADPELRRRSDSAWALVTFLGGDAAALDVAAAAAREVEADPARDLVDPTWSWGTLGAYMLMCQFAELYDEADRVFRIASQAAERLGAPMAIGLLAALQADTLIRKGRLAEAMERARQSLQMVELVPWLAAYAWVAMASLQLELGSREEAVAWCDRIERLPPSFILRMWVLRTRGILLAREGRHREASDRFLEVERIADEAGLREPCVVPWARDAITSHVAAGRLADARRVVDWLTDVSAGLPCRWPRVTIRFGRAQIAEQEGDRAAAEEGYSAALAAYEQLGQPLSRIRTQLVYGSFLRRSGLPSRARPILAAAAELAERMGARWLLDEARAELAAAGGRRRRGHGDELTAQESRIAALAAEGLSDEQIASTLSISRRTVETHLQHTYRKLEIGSRRELIRRRTAGALKIGTTPDDTLNPPT